MDMFKRFKSRHDDGFCNHRNCEKYNEIVSDILKDSKFFQHSADDLIKHRDVIEFSGKAIKIIQYHFNNQVKIADITDTDNNCTMRYFFWDNGELYSASEIDSAGNRIKEIHFTNGKITSCEENQYDKHKNIIRYTRRGSMPYDCKYSYDDNGNLIQKTIFKTDGSIEEEEYYSHGNLVKTIGYDSKGSRWEKEYRQEYDAAGNIIKKVELMNGLIKKEEICEYSDRGIPVKKHTDVREAFLNLNHKEMENHTEPFELVGKYNIGKYDIEGEALVSLITLTESIINLFIENGYNLIKIDCGGMSEIHSGIVSYGESYTVLEDFVQKALTDYERENEKSIGWALDFSSTFSKLIKQNNLEVHIRLDFSYRDNWVRIKGVNEETKLFNIEILQSISDTTGLGLWEIIVDK
jgi:hypothetical protein